MRLKNEKSLGLLGYIITTNNEIHSLQIKWLEYLLSHNNINGHYDLIKSILDDKDDKPPLNECLSSFKNESGKTKKKIYIMCIQLAVVDSILLDYKHSDFDENEDLFLTDLENYINNVKPEYTRPQAIRNLDLDILRQNIQPSFFNIDYDSILQVAKDDYHCYSSVFENVFENCNKLSNHLSFLSLGNNIPLLDKTVEDFICDYKQNVLQTLYDLNNSSKQKELAANSFSIALMGRTKAGKSTLHYIMTNEGKEFIGKGSQRTTRFNRVFNWHNLKIIDTPGIGSGEEEGKKDEAIALNVLSQADIICVIIIDDTIPNDVLSLLDTIAKYHKPMLILLNHKDNIRKKSHKESFIQNPKEWLSANGESGLSGYENRIIRYAAKNHYVKLIKIVPVFLLATRLGIEEKNELFYNASNYPEFVNAIASMVEQNSLIYKSQTLLDEPSIRLHEALESLEKEYNKISSLKESIKTIHGKIQKQIKKHKKEVNIRIGNSIDLLYDDFITTYLYPFIDEYYTLIKPSSINDAFNQTLKKFNMNYQIQRIIDEYRSKYQKIISNLVKEIDEELNYAKLNLDEIHDSDTSVIKKNRRTFPIKEILKSFSTALDVFVSIWPILAVISIPLSIVSSLFKSKQKRIADAKAIAKDNFLNLSDYSKGTVTQHSINELTKAFETDKENIDQFFSYIISQLENILKQIELCKKEFQNGIIKMDCCLANRIIQYISSTDKDFNIIKTTRDLSNNCFTIWIKRSNIYCIKKKNIEKYNSISTERIKIKYIK